MTDSPLNEPRAYYNENDKFAAQWLRELITTGMIANGDVDDRPIQEVTPSDLEGYTQCHFFAGIGVWSHALRRAGWPDDREVWTGSCPCQPFSAAGKRGGESDERHLWPYWFPLIAVREPSVVFGEQVASSDGLGWLDTVSTDMEGAGYSFGAADLCAASIGAPHIRQRLYFVGALDNAERSRTGRTAFGERREERASQERGQDERSRRLQALDTSAVSVMADSDRTRRGARRPSEESNRRYSSRIESTRLRDVGGVADSGNPRFEGRLSGRQSPQRQIQHRYAGRDGATRPLADTNGGFREDSDIQRSRRYLQRTENPLAGFWSEADWIPCIDGKYRPVEPSTFPLAHGAPARMGRLRGYGNALVAEVAKTFIEAYMTCE